MIDPLIINVYEDPEPRNITESLLSSSRYREVLCIVRMLQPQLVHVLRQRVNSMLHEKGCGDSAVSTLAFPFFFPFLFI